MPELVGIPYDFVDSAQAVSYYWIPLIVFWAVVYYLLNWGE